MAIDFDTFLKWACDHFGGYVGAWRIIPIVSIPPEVLEQARAG